MNHPDSQSLPEADFDNLPLPDPYPEYLVCPHCGEPEVEVWCFQPGVKCHTCGGWVEHLRPDCFGSEHCWGVLKEWRERD